MAKNKKYVPEGMVTLPVSEFEHYVAEHAVGKFNVEVLAKERNNLEAEVERLNAEINALQNELTDIKSDKEMYNRWWIEAVKNHDTYKKELEAEKEAHEHTKNLLKLEQDANEVMEAYIHADDFRAEGFDEFRNRGSEDYVGGLTEHEEF